MSNDQGTEDTSEINNDESAEQRFPSRRLPENNGKLSPLPQIRSLVTSLICLVLKDYICYKYLSG